VYSSLAPFAGRGGGQQGQGQQRYNRKLSDAFSSRGVMPFFGKDPLIDWLYKLNTLERWRALDQVNQTFRGLVRIGTWVDQTLKMRLHYRNTSQYERIMILYNAETNVVRPPRPSARAPPRRECRRRRHPRPARLRGTCARAPAAAPPRPAATHARTGHGRASAHSRARRAPAPPARRSRPDPRSSPPAASTAAATTSRTRRARWSCSAR
jgi:hypothetical protein